MSMEEFVDYLDREFPIFEEISPSSPFSVDSLVTYLRTENHKLKLEVASKKSLITSSDSLVENLRAEIEKLKSENTTLHQRVV